MKYNHDGLISIAQMCKLLNRDRRTLWTWVKNGDFPQPVRHQGRTLGWLVESYRTWLAGLLG
ncbi:helix-turn-helix transcriptional regulator [Oceanisphaera sp. W20_SRM_FM3]|uniref:helix-turn-helix transcriptional regulator n=1 Tax=Oceanisphaera sp. W20_SRM_FM3 TaxID=3240267 RepID=UPI003F97ABC6